MAGELSSAGSETVYGGSQAPILAAQCCGGSWWVTVAKDLAVCPQVCVVPGFTTKSLFPTLSEGAKSQHLLQGSSLHAQDLCQGQGDAQPPQAAPPALLNITAHVILGLEQQ